MQEESNSVVRSKLMYPKTLELKVTMWTFRGPKGNVYATVFSKCLKVNFKLIDQKNEVTIQTQLFFSEENKVPGTLFEELQGHIQTNCFDLYGQIVFSVNCVTKFKFV